MNEELGKELGWDDQIENEGTDYEPLPDGTYEFTVESMERGRFPGSDKMVACNKAGLKLRVKDEKGNDRYIFEDLMLNSKTEWKLSQFFICIGQKKSGEPLKPNWSAVPGSTGKMEIYINEYTNKAGKKMKNNKVDKFLPPEPKTYQAGKF